jgi:hypothetical protein
LPRFPVANSIRSARRPKRRQTLLRHLFVAMATETPTIPLAKRLLWIDSKTTETFQKIRSLSIWALSLWERRTTNWLKLAIDFESTIKPILIEWIRSFQSERLQVSFGLRFQKTLLSFFSLKARR